jgi:hypothetical protein
VPANKGTLQHMKIAELNIGLSSKSLGELNHETVLNELKVCDFRVITSRVVESTSEDGKELCLACKVELPNDWQNSLAYLSDKLGQDCIAVVGFIGHAPYDTFAPSLWVSPEVETPELVLYHVCNDYSLELGTPDISGAVRRGNEFYDEHGDLFAVYAAPGLDGTEY